MVHVAEFLTAMIEIWIQFSSSCFCFRHLILGDFRKYISAFSVSAFAPLLHKKKFKYSLKIHTLVFQNFHRNINVSFRFIFCELLEILPCLEQIGTCIHCGYESTVTRLVMRPLQATGENPLQSENGYKHIGFDDEPCRIHLSLICLREQKPDSFLTGGAILRICELICSLDFDHKWRTKVDRTANGSEYGLLKERKSKEVKAKQKVLWKDKLRLC